MWKKFDSLKKRLKYNESEMPFLEHLEQLRKTIIYMGSSLLIGFVICFPFGKNILGVLLKPAEPFVQSFSNQTNELGIFLVFQEPTSSIKMVLLVTLFGGIFVSLPAMLYFLATFIFPGIKEKEQKALKRIIIFSSSLFFLGIFMGFKNTLPLAMEWMIKLVIFLVVNQFGFIQNILFFFTEHVSVWISLSTSGNFNYFRKNGFYWIEFIEKKKKTCYSYSISLFNVINTP